MHLILTGLLMLTSFSLFAEDKVILKNDREGKSFYNSRSIRKSHERALKGINSQDILKAFTSILDSMPENKLCSYSINEQLNIRLKSINPKFKELEGALYHLRSKNEIDDVALKILIKANEVETTELDLPKHEEDLWLPNDNAKVSEIIKLIGGFKAKLQDSCLDEAYGNLYGEISKVDKSFRTHHYEALFVEAYKMKLIDIRTYKSLEKARENELEKNGLNLKSYYKKVKSLRTHFPLRDANERSDFSTNKFNKKSSNRIHLLETYSDLQIMLMGSVIKKLRSRLDSDKMEILVYARETVDEVIPLDPMERFRFSIKILRKEMALLALNTYFKGSSPSYIDIMTAAYEVGIIPASEVDEVAGLELIWNPKKTFWDKAQVWVRTLGSVAAIAVPPPYGFIPALALMVIEFTVSKKDKNTEDTSSLF
ncbi:MAG TPA: hypothetical protein VNJ08_16570 [Bacteriovoracaceae bacterium]|nr:hypothetical protein [Bacteriovoracaceae bacterium]